MSRTHVRDGHSGCAACGVPLAEWVPRPETTLTLAPLGRSRSSASAPASAAPGCSCRVCLPGRLDDRDPAEATVLRHVREHGWSVMAVGADGTSPPFAYTIGLHHHTGQPELLMSGQPRALLHAVLNDVAARVVGGSLRLEPGAAVEETLAWFPLLAERVRPVGAGELVTYASWFHRRPVSALQLVWPDARGLFPWQPGATDTSFEQPPGWRRPAGRAGCFAVDPPWLWPVPADHVMAGCRHVVEAGAAVATVLRAPLDGDEVWIVLCERHDHRDDLVGAHFAHYARSMPALREVADLAVGEGATRSGPDAPWSHFRLSEPGGRSA